ncbi:WD repeat-containing protein 7-like isoform X2 [Lingula anatina]|uniref:WD repeat-containing protein 7-like isoform X2 n=1 Tax=Lingula anatina TaxID=7574 RepID=A0A1S3JC39_LINAN|nr:WD repeat-containing protein 7-like isoform X2 [Lingula anatina]|eukprot:XP_013407449.1 WD repeat-containing protein 7-like isoform X2 [Lingula anatina]
MSGSNLVVPIILWGRHAPTHCVSAILMTSDQRNIITGCNDGQIIIWDVLEDWTIYPRSMLYGHNAAINCLAMASKNPHKPYIASAADNGEICLWDVSDGRCIEHHKSASVHTSMQSYHMLDCKDFRLVCNGYYPEIQIIDPANLTLLYTLSSKISSDWISAFCILRPVNREDDVVVAISNSGTVKVWTLEPNSLKNKEIFEDESKHIRCLNAQTLTCCAYNQRTVLIVCSKYWQIYGCVAPSIGDPEIYDAGDFSLLCSESARTGERWSGGEFIAVDKVIVWSSEGKGYLYKLPMNLLKGKVLQSANPKSQEFRKMVGNVVKENAAPMTYGVLDVLQEQKLVCSPAMTYFFGTMWKQQKMLLRGDSEGRIVVWCIPEVTEQQMTLVRQESFDRLPAVHPKASLTLQEAWDSLDTSPVGILDLLSNEGEKPQQITATIYIPSQGRLVCGREDGSIVIVPATQSVIMQLLDSKHKIKHDHAVHKVLDGHKGRVTALLYPFNDGARYEPQHLVSGGADFCVFLWDIYTGIKLHTFTVHGGEITQLMVPPDGCNARIQPCICSVASDHSVALLSLKERKCITMASRHMFPVQTIKWRPLDDFMVVGCTDGTVYVWQMETGHLDRVVHGTTAVDILHACDEMMKAEGHSVHHSESLVNPTISIAQAFRRRNLATFKNLAEQKFKQINQPGSDPTRNRTDLSGKTQAFPMMIQGIKANLRDPESHVLFFDTEALIVQLLSDEYAAMSPGTMEAHGIKTISQHSQSEQKTGTDEIKQKFEGFLAKVKDKAENVGQEIQARMEAAGKPHHAGTHRPHYHKHHEKGGATHKGRGKPQRPSQPPQYHHRKHAQRRPKNIYLTEGNLTMEIAQLLMSCLHAWGLDPDLDKLCISKLGLLTPLAPISFGLISRGGHMSLLLPGWHKKLCLQSKLVLDKKGKSAEPTASPALSVDREAQLFTSRAHWEVSEAVTTQHLLSVISIANTVMSMNSASFLVGKSPVSLTRKIFDSQGLLMSQTFSSSDEDDTDGTSSADSIVIEQAQTKQGWSLLATLHCVLLPDLVGTDMYKNPKLQMLASRWQDRCLELQLLSSMWQHRSVQIREAAQALLLAELRRLGPEGRRKVVQEWAPYLPNYIDPSLGPQEVHGAVSSGKTEELPEEEEEEQEDISEVQEKIQDNSYETRRKQATAIVMLGVIGAEFGQEIVSSRGGDQQKGVVEGFSINQALARRTSNALTYLLLQPSSPQLPANTPIRRAAIDLIGRGFTVWQPYLDVSAVLLGLLELCVDGDKLVPSMTFGLPLSSQADACRTARHSLALIATARPPAFIITMAKEVARYNAMAQNAQSQSPSLHTSVLVRGKSEIMRVIEHLIDKLPNDVAELMVEAMDITVHCLDHTAVKTKGLQEVFAPICKFCIVSYDTNSRRICVGARNGGLTFYELKHAKSQTIPAHSKPITAVCFSPDGKFLAAYCHEEKRLTFWQASSGSLFGIGQQHTKCVKTFSTPAFHVNPAMNVLKLARLIWTDNRQVVLLMLDGSETRYRV